MPDPIVERIVRESGVPELVEVLSERLAPTDLQSLLLAVQRARASRLTPADVLRVYDQSRLVRLWSGSATRGYRRREREMHQASAVTSSGETS